MTLCIVWKQEKNIKFVSDSRLSFGDAPPQDCGIKVLRVPYCISGPTDQNDATPVIATGELGMAIAGNAVAALMVKEALGEVIANLQAIPQYHDIGMDAVADVFFRGYRIISTQICNSLFNKGRTCIVFAGYCALENRLRAYRMETHEDNRKTCDETLLAEMDREVFGSPEAVVEAQQQLQGILGERQVVGVMQRIIDDPAFEGVGGNIQFGQFSHKLFRPYGTARHVDGQERWNYWRGSLDLNGPEFDPDGLHPRLPYIDLSV